jgi:hypothetical protein
MHGKLKEPKANLYHHYDGYPENMEPKLYSLLKKAGRVLKKRGYCATDPGKLAAQLVALSVDDDGIPAFEPCLSQHCDIRHLYRVFWDECGEPEVVVEDVIPSIIRDIMARLPDDDDLKKCLLEEMSCSERKQVLGDRVQENSND